MMLFLNCTPHVINIHLPSGRILTLSPSGILPRVAQTTETAPALHGVGVTFSSFGTVEGLPAPVEGTYLIVSGMVLAQCQDRPDVFAPGLAVRDADGKIIGCQGLACTKAYMDTPAPEPTPTETPAEEATEETTPEATEETTPEATEEATEEVTEEVTEEAPEVWACFRGKKRTLISGNEYLEEDPDGDIWIWRVVRRKPHRIEGKFFLDDKDIVGEGWLSPLDPKAAPAWVQLKLYDNDFKPNEVETGMEHARDHTRIRKTIIGLTGKEKPESLAYIGNVWAWENSIESDHWLTYHLLREVAPERRQEAIDFLTTEGRYDVKAAERAGAVAWFTPRPNQKVAWQSAAGKRQWLVAAPSHMEITPERHTNRVVFRNVSFRRLFKRGGSKDFKIAYVIDGVGTETLEIKIW